MRVRLLIAISLIITLSACFSSKSPETPSTETPSPETGIAPSIFPHKSGWKEPDKHGVYVRDILGMDLTNCLGCHKETDTISGGAPGCRSCHAVFPHTEPGVTKETHGDYVLKNGKAACATTCHGTDWKGGLSGVACSKCHSYPHADAWSTPAVHGPLAMGDLKIKNNCSLCHGSDFSGGKTKVSCLNCHKGNYPHPTGWSAPDQHGAFVSKNGTGKCATQCHGVQLEGGLSGVNCKTCHNVWPHPASGWMAQHGEKARGIGLNGCVGCHKSDATGGKTGVSCAKCHPSLPSHQDSDWTKTGHGKMVMQQPSTLTDNNGCPLCHGATLEGGKAPVSPTLKALKGCKDCHASYPALHKSTVGTPAWNTYDGHGKWVINQIKADKDGKFANVLGEINTLITDCKLCHGDDLKGGATEKGCYVSGCHVNFPHDMDPAATPWLAKHGLMVNAEKPTKAVSCATANCHGKDSQGLPAGENVVVKKWVRGCADCHLLMPHKPLDQWAHGKSVLITGTKSLDVNQCTSCHGGDWKGKNDAPSCYTSNCHDTYPLPHRLANGLKNPTWKSLIGHGSAVMVASQGGSIKDKGVAACVKCHGADLSGGPSVVSCYKCHPSFPHAAAPVTANGVTYPFTDATWNDFDKGHGQYLAARAANAGVAIADQSQKECAKSCHGTDLKGGTSKKSCYTCHGSYPHEAGWANVVGGGTHGPFVIANGKVGCLTGCHGSDGSGGNSGKVCTSCHAAYPHLAATWKAGHKDYISQLAANKMITPFAIITLGCKGCHISDGKNDCTSCHHKTLNGPDWKNKDKHGASATKDSTGCKNCHGPDLNAGSLTSGNTCVACHGPGTKATLSSHQDKVETQTYFNQCCDDCIDGDKENCSDCTNNAYYNCGDPLQKTVTTSFVQTLHKDMAKQNLKSCQACHGSDLKGGISGKPCYICHDPGAKYPLHATQKEKWKSDIQNKTVELIAKLKGSMYKNCWSACHTYIYMPPQYPQAPVNAINCLDCHKSAP